jgi:PPOX class probable F420-dependent enzyme
MMYRNRSIAEVSGHSNPGSSPRASPEVRVPPKVRRASAERERMILDLTQPFHGYIDRRLRAEPIIWLTTASLDGRTHIVPMWFHWDGRIVVLFSLPNTKKLRHIASNPSVSLALEAADHGYDIVIIEGRASLIDDPHITGQMPSFVAKYADVPRRWEPREWAEKFSKTIQVMPTKLKAWRTNPSNIPQYLSIPF